MPNNTSRANTSGGDTIRSDQDLFSGTLEKIQVMKIGRGHDGVDSGLVDSRNPLSVATHGGDMLAASFGDMLKAFHERADHKDRRFKRRRPLGGGSRLSGSLMHPGFTDYPGTLYLSGWWRAPYNGKPWWGNNSLGVSGPNNPLTESFPTPSVGASLNGYTVADYDGVDDEIGTATGPARQMTFFLTTTSGTIICLFNADTADADDPITTWANPSLCGMEAGGGGVTLAYSSAGARAGIFTGGAWVNLSVAASTGSWHVAMMKWGGGTMYLRVDSGSWSSIAAGAITDLASYMISGINQSGAVFYDGSVAEIMMSQNALSDSECDGIKAYMNARYGLSL